MWERERKKKEREKWKNLNKIFKSVVVHKNYLRFLNKISL